LKSILAANCSRAASGAVTIINYLDLWGSSKRVVCATRLQLSQSICKCLRYLQNWMESLACILWRISEHLFFGSRSALCLSRQIANIWAVLARNHRYQMQRTKNLMPMHSIHQKCQRTIY